MTALKQCPHGVALPWQSYARYAECSPSRIHGARQFVALDARDCPHCLGRRVSNLRRAISEFFETRGPEYKRPPELLRAMERLIGDWADDIKEWGGLPYGDDPTPREPAAPPPPDSSPSIKQER